MMNKWFAILMIVAVICATTIELVKQFEVGKCYQQNSQEVLK